MTAKLNARFRGCVVHGWAFREHTEDEIATIRKFLASGEREDLPETYQPIFDVVVEGQRGSKR